MKLRHAPLLGRIKLTSRRPVGDESDTMTVMPTNQPVDNNRNNVPKMSNGA
jgi:hypothetical protein